jgi:Domain of unknown function (DUF4149)
MSELVSRRAWMVVIPQAVERVLLTLWVGSLWTTGLVIAPTLFRSYERAVAGEIAGRLFAAMSLLGMLCAVLLLVFAVVRCRSQVCSHSL